MKLVQIITGLACILALSCVSTDAPAAEAQSSDPLENYKKYSVDLSVPDSPGFVIIGATPDKVVTPKSFRDLAISFADGLGASGKVEHAFAIDFSLGQLMRQWEIATIRGNRAEQSANTPPGFQEALSQQHNNKFLLRTNVSLAATKVGETGDKTAKLGTGVHFTLYDAADPRFDDIFLACVTSATAPLLKSPEPSSVEALEKASAETDSCAASAKLRAQRAAIWNSTKWVAALGQAWATSSGELSKLKKDTVAAWTTASFAFGAEASALKGQWIVHLQRKTNELITDPTDDKKTVRQASTLAGLKLVFGNENITGSIESSQSRVNYDFGRRDRIRKTALGIDYRIAEDLWISVSVGGEGGRKDGENKRFVLGNLRWGMKQTPVFGQ